MKNLFKGICLVAALMATFAMVGCGGGGGKTTTNPNTNVGVLIPLPTGGNASMRGSVRAAVAEDKFKAYYLNSSNIQIAADNISGLNTATATVAFMNVPPGSDLVIKSEMDNGNGFKLYYQGLVKKSELVGGGTQVGKKFNSETTAKAMLFEEKKKTVTNLSIENFEYTMEQEEAKGKDVWAVLGVTSADMEKSLTDLTVETDIRSKAKTAADSLEIKEKPAPQPTPSGYASREALENATWTAADESVVFRLVTSSASEAAKILYIYNGEKWETPTEAYFVEADIFPYMNLHYFAFGLVDSKYTGMGQIFPFVDDNNTYFSYEIHVNENKTLSGALSFETAEVGGVTYLKGTDKEKDANGNIKVFYMASVAIPEDLANAIADMKGSPVYPNELIKELDTAEGWVEATEELNTLLTTNDNKVVALLFSTEDGLTFKDRMNDDYSIHFEKMAEGYELLQHNSFETTGPAYKFYYSSGDDPKFVYFHKDLEKYNETTGDYENIFFGVYRVSKLVKDGRDYYRAINETDSESDLYLKEKHYFLLTDREITSGGVVTGSRR